MPCTFHRFSIAIVFAFLGVTTDTNGHGGTLASLEGVDRQLCASPHNPRLHIRRASLLLENEQPAAALEAVARARSLGAGSVSLSLIKAQALLALDRPDESLATLAGCPLTVPVLSHRVRALHASGKASAAIVECRALLAIAPDPDIAFLAAGILAENHDMPAAILLLDSVFPGDARPSSLELRALDYEIALKSWDAALARITRRISSSARPEPWIARRAEILTTAGRTAEAAKTWQHLLTSIRNLPPAIRASHSMLRLAQKARAATEPSTR